MDDDKFDRWEYFRQDIEDAIERFSSEEDDLPPSTVRIITNTLRGMLDRMTNIENYDKEDIKLIKKEKKPNGNYH